MSTITFSYRTPFVNRKGDSIGDKARAGRCRQKRVGSFLPAPPPRSSPTERETAAKLWVFGWPGSLNAIGEPAIRLPVPLSSTRSLETVGFAIANAIGRARFPFPLALHNCTTCVG